MYILSDTCRITSSRITRIMFILELAWCVIQPHVRPIDLKSHDFTKSFHGYCPTEGFIAPNLIWHHCKFFCLHKSGWEALNYDLLPNLCTYFTATCPLAIWYPTMFLSYSLEGKQNNTCSEFRRKTAAPYRTDICDHGQQEICSKDTKDGYDFICYTCTYFKCGPE